MSPARTFNEDVLYEVLSYVDDPRQLSRTALVCRSWLHQSRVWLYMHVVQDVSLKYKALKLAYTLETNDQLRSLVREISVIHTAEVDDLDFGHLYTWFLLIAPEQILRLDLSFRQGNQRLLDLILSCPFIENLQHLRVIRRQVLEAGITFSNFLQHFPAVKSVQADVPVCCVVEDGSRIVSPITQLNVSLWSPSIRPLLNALGSTRVLTHLALRVVDHVHIILPPCFEKTLHRIGESLISLSVRYSTAHSTQTHLVDHFLKHASRLQHLECGLSTYDPEMLFRRLPKSIKTLKLYSNNNVPFPFDAALIVAKSKERGESQLETLTLIRNVFGHEQGFSEFRDTCREVGIDFRYTICALKCAQEFQLHLTRVRAVQMQ